MYQFGLQAMLKYFVNKMFLIIFLNLINYTVGNNLILFAQEAFLSVRLTTVVVLEFGAGPWLNTFECQTYSRWQCQFQRKHDFCFAQVGETHGN